MKFLPGASAFLTGCNYWSSEAGIRMWHDWSEKTVEKDNEKNYVLDDFIKEENSKEFSPISFYLQNSSAS